MHTILPNVFLCFILPCHLLSVNYFGVFSLNLSNRFLLLIQKKKSKKKSSGAWMHPGKTAELSSAFLAVRPGGRSCISLSFQEKQFPPFVGLSVSLTLCICCRWGLHIAGLPINSPQTVISINTSSAFHSCDQKSV